MSGPNDKTEELIGAYLDGELRPAERIEVERYLQSDPQAAELLAQMKSIRSALQSAPKRKLPANFSERVIAAARQDAAQLGPAAPHWLAGGKRSKPQTVSPQAPIDSPIIAVPATTAVPATAVELRATVADHPSNRRWIWALTIAASTLLLVFVGYKQLNRFTSQDVVSIQQTNAPPVVGADSNQDSASQIASSDESSTDLVVEPTPDRQEKNTDSVLATDTNARARSEEVSDLLPSMPVDVTPVPNVSGSNIARSESDMQAELEKALAQSTKNLMFVMDVSVTDEATKNEAVRKTLERYNIAYELPIEITSDLHAALEKNRYVGPIAPPGLNAGNEVSLIFVKAGASRLDAAMTDIYSRYEEFPEVSYDMALNPPAPEALEMLKSLREFSEFDLSKARERSGMARGLKVANGSFVAPERRATIPLDLRKKASAPKVVDVDMNPTAYCLFVIRQPSLTE